MFLEDPEIKESRGIGEGVERKESRGIGEGVERRPLTLSV